MGIGWGTSLVHVGGSTPQAVVTTLVVLLWGKTTKVVTTNSRPICAHVHLGLGKYDGDAGAITRYSVDLMPAAKERQLRADAVDHTDAALDPIGRQKGRRRMTSQKGTSGVRVICRIVYASRCSNSISSSVT